MLRKLRLLLRLELAGLEVLEPSSDERADLVESSFLLSFFDEENRLARLLDERRLWSKSGLVSSSCSGHTSVRGC